MAYRLCALLLICLWSPSFAQAQDSARVLFSEGVALADAGQWPLAVTRFRAALAEHPSSVIEFNLGLALSHTSQLMEAIEVLERVASRAGVDAALRTEAEDALSLLRLQIAEVDVSYAGPTEGLTLVVDGFTRPLADMQATMRFDPGAHTVTLDRGSVTVARGTLRLARGAHARLVLEDISARPPRVEPVPRPTTTTLPRAHDPEPTSRDDTDLWLGLGIGGGVLVTIGAVTLAIVLTSASSPSPFSGSLGTVEIDR